MLELKKTRFFEYFLRVLPNNQKKNKNKNKYILNCNVIFPMKYVNNENV